MGRARDPGAITNSAMHATIAATTLSAIDTGLAARIAGIVDQSTSQGSGARPPASPLAAFQVREWAWRGLPDSTSVGTRPRALTRWLVAPPPCFRHAPARMPCASGIRRVKRLDPEEPVAGREPDALSRVVDAANSLLVAAEHEKAPPCGAFSDHPRRLGLPRTIRSTRPSTLISPRRSVFRHAASAVWAAFWMVWTGWTGWMLPRALASYPPNHYLSGPTLYEQRLGVPGPGSGEYEVRGDARVETRCNFRTGITSVVPCLVRQR